MAGEYVPSAARQRLEAAVLPPVDSLSEILARARAAMREPAPASMPQQAPTVPPMAAGLVQSLRARDADMAEREATFNGNLARLLARLRGEAPLMPPASTGSLSDFVNARRVPNPMPSITPSPMIGNRG